MYPLVSIEVVELKDSKLFLFMILGLALNCQVCGGLEGVCQNENDNGESKACPTDTEEQVCLYNEVRKS